VTLILSAAALAYFGFAIYHIWDRPGFLTAAFLGSYGLSVFFGSLGGVLGLLALFAVLCTWATRPVARFRSPGPEISLLLWATLSCLTLFGSIDYDSTQEFVSALIVLCGGAYFLGRTFGTSENFLRDLVLGAIAVLLICAPGVVLHAKAGVLDAEQNSVGLAVLVEVPLVGALALLMFEDLSRRVRLALVGLIFLVILPFGFVLGNRSIFLGALAAFGFFVAVRIRQGRAGRILAAIAVSMILIVVAASILLSQLKGVVGAQIVSIGIERLTQNFSGTGVALNDPSARSRLGIYAQAFKAISEAPIFGHGLGSLGDIVNYSEPGAYPHNMFLEIMIDTGLVGLMLFLGALLPMGWRVLTWAWRRDADWRAMFLAGLLMETLVRHQVSMSVTTAKVLFFTLGVIASAWAATLQIERPRPLRPDLEPVAPAAGG
jgi:O-antigen ligase